MKNAARYVSLLAMGTCLFAGSALADSFSYSYAFVGNVSPYNSGVGHEVSGTFEGTANGNLITGISNVTVNLDNNQLISGNVFAEGLVGSNYVDGAAVVSFDGTQNNFSFFDADFAMGYQFDRYFFGVSGAPNWPVGYSQFEASAVTGGNYRDIFYPPSYNTPNGSWVVSDTSNVPDSGTTFVLVGSALVGLAALRRRFVRA